jgi:hypothetical protein
MGQGRMHLQDRLSTDNVSNISIAFVQAGDMLWTVLLPSWCQDRTRQKSGWPGWGADHHRLIPWRLPPLVGLLFVLSYSCQDAAAELQLFTFSGRGFVSTKSLQFNRI